MKLIPLSSGKHGFAQVDDEDYARVSQFKWQPERHGKITYAKHTIYVAGGKGKVTRNVLLHRFILGLEGSSLPHVDHDNGDGLDCQKHNLRPATHSQNQQNLHRNRDGKTSKYKGVSKTKRGKPWRAAICLDKKRIYIGAFDLEDDAALAYDQVARRLFGKFARTNFQVKP